LATDYYSLLSLSPEATQKEIKAAYRRMAEVYHPDKLRELPPGDRKEGEEIMRLLNEAKSILLDPERRAEYDRFRGNSERRMDAIVLGEEEDFNDFVIEIGREEVEGKMQRVLTSMKDVFSRDRSFQKKIAEASEIVEAQVLEEAVLVARSRPKEPHPQEMALEFPVVSKRAVPEPGKTVEESKEPPKIKGRFRILAIEDSDQGEKDRETKDGGA